MDGLTDGRTDGGTDERTDGRTEGRTDGRTDGPIKIDLEYNRPATVFGDYRLSPAATTRAPLGDSRSAPRRMIDERGRPTCGRD